MGKRTETLADLRHRAQVALDACADDSERLLEKLVKRAPKGSEPAIFAHRHLAEIRLESSTWKAALHLRHVLRARPHDDVVHALSGLCHALLGNYRVAVKCYRVAIRVSPHIPWYHHNLGHLVDVALGDPASAEAYLRRAHEIESDHDEIMGSLAHCLAGIHSFEEALELARAAQRLAPKNDDHGQLIAWIERGAPDHEKPNAPFNRPSQNTPDEVADVLESTMKGGGFSKGEVNRAKKLWRDLKDRKAVRYVKPEVYAATLEYAIASIHRRAGWTQALVAQRYGVASTSVSARYSQIRDALSLTPDDPRYASFR